MKNKFFGIIICMAIITFSAGCGDDSSSDTPQEQAQNQSATLTDLFGEGYSATVEGNLTDTQWNGVSGKIEVALNDAFEAGNAAAKGRFRVVFGRAAGVKIIVEKTSDYTNYETTGDGVTLFLNLDALDNADLQAKITAAVAAMRNDEATMAKVIKPKAIEPKVGSLAFAKETADVFGYTISKNQTAAKSKLLVATR